MVPLDRLPTPSNLRKLPYPEPGPAGSGLPTPLALSQTQKDQGKSSRMSEWQHRPFSLDLSACQACAPPTRWFHLRDSPVAGPPIVHQQ